MQLPRLTTRRWMVAVDVAGGALGWIAYARNVLREDDEFGLGTLGVEGFCGATVPLPAVLAIGLIVHLSRKEVAYLARVRRDETPVTCHLFPVEPGPPEPIIGASSEIEVIPAGRIARRGSTCDRPGRA